MRERENIKGYYCAYSMLILTFGNFEMSLKALVDKAIAAGHGFPRQ
jgi:hypothetical protein